MASIQSFADIRGVGLTLKQHRDEETGENRVYVQAVRPDTSAAEVSIVHTAHVM
jgi:hypothetical protein